ncbi:MAG: branched-chain-amino-acid transaminase [bacterium]|nr:branched-chain-amino-acid transaminase [bacterium]
MAELVWVNGEFLPKAAATVSVFDHGLLYGDGVFEGIKSWDGKVFKLREHIQRFFDSCHFLCIHLVQTPEEMERIVLNTVAMNELHHGVSYIRLVATRGTGDLGINPRKCKGDPTVFCIASEIQLYPREKYESGIDVITSSVRRNSVQSLPARVKSLNYLNNILGVIEANNNNVEEAIMLTLDGYVAEATADNVFFAKGGVVKTPALHHGLLAGITRESVIEIGRRSGFTVEEGTYLSFDLYTADECWLTGTGADLIPVVGIDGRRIGDGRPGPIFKRIRSQWLDYVDEPLHHSRVPTKESVMAD